MQLIQVISPAADELSRPALLRRRLPLRASRAARHHHRAGDIRGAACASHPTSNEFDGLQTTLQARAMLAAAAPTKFKTDAMAATRNSFIMALSSLERYFHHDFRNYLSSDFVAST
ncbi:hypothetical protein [Bradyrhizobium macuxiense]|uniref:hypothetical protein n=1 Tax=Bradyrhizobium macuxiense TaxID=1755647 RepID=UPI0010A96011|nr:hypothetical protein [Bradyrhizobium macuxiense]